MRLLNIILLLFFIGGITFAQDNCKVSMESISGTYEGGCKKGLADGIGEAKGTDSYKGQFKKGLPNGKGVYTWANGNVYDGEWKKGKMHGQGKMMVKVSQDADSTYIGYWQNDEYIGTEKEPYKILNQDPKITSMTFTRKSGDKQQIDIIYEQLGKKIRHAGISLKPMSGAFGNVVDNGFVKSVQFVQYPFRAIINSSENFEIQITQPGHWEIKVNLAKQ
ncbi:hypothetical protein QQ008_07955 [Fulvivirgaceae bacterium BMA10]|uniref:MORN repeat protein n=1 Tax=Splendidivirga corallicola TaxID=3051826 RepID=A0ABT8KKP3_9BACT|nr:hypothetical protein [Fulvivirgaceae bacterium BMA10]